MFHISSFLALQIINNAPSFIMPSEKKNIYIYKIEMITIKLKEIVSDSSMQI